MTDFADRAAVLPAAPPEIGKHVYYAPGLVLGVDEYRQEFAYLNGRDRSLASDLIGYGTVCGLRLLTQVDAGGPQLVLAAGVAISPGGQLIRVETAQAARLDDWLTAHQAEVMARLESGSGSPPQDAVTVHVVLCYRPRLADDKPIPGEPCRSDDTPTIPSRVADDFQLELRFDAPDQREEEALRRFIDWLGRVPTSDAAGSATLDEFTQALRDAAPQFNFIAGSPPDAPFASPPASLRIPAHDAGDYVRAALRVWITEMRPLWHRIVLGGGEGSGDDAGDAASQDECVLLGTVTMPLAWGSPGWEIDDPNRILIDESRRPFLTHLRLLQEWVLCGQRERAAAAAVQHPGDRGVYGIVAGGRVRGDGTGNGYNDLAVVGAPVGEGELKLTFRDYQPPAAPIDYVVKVLPVVRPGSPQPEPIVANFDRYEADGLVLHLADRHGDALSAAALVEVELMVEISRWEA